MLYSPFDCLGRVLAVFRTLKLATDAVAEPFYILWPPFGYRVTAHDVITHRNLKISCKIHFCMQARQAYTYVPTCLKQKAGQNP